MDSPFLGGLYPVSFNFAPNGFAMCNGQLLAINTNTALFSLVGTYYGGNGTNNFALPDLRGRLPVHQGQGAGLSNYTIGQVGGAETVTLTTNQLPSHSHALIVNGSAATTVAPGSGTYLAAGPQTGSGPNATQLPLFSTSPGATVLSSGSIHTTGGGQAVSLLIPYLTVTWVIALQGIFPSRN